MTLSSLVLLSLPALADGPLVEITGTCPGTVAITISQATPNGRYAILTARDSAGGQVPSGPCAGINSSLETSTTKTRKTKTASATGTGLVIPNLPEQVCGHYLQVVDLETCEVGNLEMLARNERSFRLPGAPYTFDVPDGVEYLVAHVSGAQGGAAVPEIPGGLGAEVHQLMHVEPNERLEIRVGGAGSTATTAAVTPGGYNGGGEVRNPSRLDIPAASGGGASDIRRAPYTAGSWKIIAAGGAGSAYIPGGWVTGNGGAPDGQDGLAGNTPGADGGDGATPWEGGAGAFSGDAGDGALLTGGYCTISDVGCGAGGGGWFGGGGGHGGTGGGGASWFYAFGAGVGMYPGIEQGDGEVTLRW